MSTLLVIGLYCICAVMLAFFYLSYRKTTWLLYKYEALQVEVLVLGAWASLVTINLLVANMYAGWLFQLVVWILANHIAKRMAKANLAHNVYLRALSRARIVNQKLANDEYRV